MVRRRGEVPACEEHPHYVRKNELEEGQLFAAYPDVYHPRNNSVYSCGETLKGYLLETELDRKMYISKLKDSSERLKIMSILLAQQAKELEENGEILTMLYYPEETE